MKKKATLFELIKSMSNQEKIYFKKLANSNGKGKQLIKLFDAYDDQLMCDENKIKEQFKNESFIKHLHVTKINLTDLVLKSLRSFHKSSSASIRLHNYIIEIEILFVKEQFNLCYQKIDKAERLAKEYNYLELQHIILSWKLKLSLNSQSTIETNSILAELSDNLDKRKKENGFWHASVNIYNTREAKNYLMSNEVKETDTFRSKVLDLYCKSTIFFMEGNLEKSHLTSKSLILLYEDNLHLVLEDPQPYITAICNHLSVLTEKNDWSAISTNLDKINKLLSSLKNQLSNVSTKSIARVYNFQLSRLKEETNVSRSDVVLTSVIRFTENNIKIISADYQLMLYFQLAEVYFLNNDYKSALKYLNLILQQNFGELKLEIQAYSRIMILFVHFELGNFDLVPYIASSSKRFLKRIGYLSVVELSVIRFIVKLCDYPSGKAKIIDDFKSDLTKLVKPTKNDLMLHYFNVFNWMKSK